jgi:hypothetical protein
MAGDVERVDDAVGDASDVAGGAGVTGTVGDGLGRVGDTGADTMGSPAMVTASGSVSSTGGRQ